MINRQQFLIIITLAFSMTCFSQSFTYNSEIPQPRYFNGPFGTNSIDLGDYDND